jgi:branched-chain amino acid transport system substrate-binding protein
MDVSSAVILKPLNNDSAIAVSQAFRDKMVQLTGSENVIVNSLDFDPSEEDYSEQLRKIIESKAQVVFMPSHVDDAARILKQAKELGVAAKFLGTENWETVELIEKAGAEAAEGVAFSTVFDPETGITEMTEVFLTAFRNKYGEDAVPHSSTALGFDAYMLAVEAINKAGTATDGEKLMKVLARTREFQGASGSITFDAKGDPIKSVVIKTITNGEIISRYTVEPAWVNLADNEEEEE